MRLSGLTPRTVSIKLKYSPDLQIKFYPIRTENTRWVAYLNHYIALSVRMEDPPTNSDSRLLWQNQVKGFGQLLYRSSDTTKKIVKYISIFPGSLQYSLGTWSLTHEGMNYEKRASQKTHYHSLYLQRSNELLLVAWIAVIIVSAARGDTLRSPRNRKNVDFRFDSKHSTSINNHTVTVPRVRLAYQQSDSIINTPSTSPSSSSSSSPSSFSSSSDPATQRTTIATLEPCKTYSKISIPILTICWDC